METECHFGVTLKIDWKHLLTAGFFFLKNIKLAFCQEVVRAQVKSVKHELMHGRTNVHNYGKGHISEKSAAPKLGFSNLLRTRSWNQVSHSNWMQQRPRRVTSSMNWREQKMELKETEETQQDKQSNTPKDHDYSSVLEVLTVDAIPFQIFAPINLPANDLTIP